VNGDMNGNPVPFSGDGLLLLLVLGLWVAGFLIMMVQQWQRSRVPYTPEYQAEFRRVRTLVIRRDHHQCQRCGTPGSPDNPLEVHHIKARVVGGSNDPGNLVTLCRRHHRQLPRG
jgi:5-methylcytosine-specific restriction endonuclease McrA